MRHIREAFKHLIPSQGLGSMSSWVISPPIMKKGGRMRGKKEKGGKGDEGRLG